MFEILNKGTKYSMNDNINKETISTDLVKTIEKTTNKISETYNKNEHINIINTLRTYCLPAISLHRQY